MTQTNEVATNARKSCIRDKVLRPSCMFVYISHELNGKTQYDKIGNQTPMRFYHLTFSESNS